MPETDRIAFEVVVATMFNAFSKAVGVQRRVGSSLKVGQWWAKSIDPDRKHAKIL